MAHTERNGHESANTQDRAALVASTVHAPAAKGAAGGRPRQQKSRQEPTAPAGRHSKQDGAVIQAATEQTALSARKDAMVALVSHDLQQPLTVIRAQAQFLERRLAKGQPVEVERFARGLASISAAVTSMSVMIAELLDVARLEMGQPLELLRCPTDLVALVREIATRYQFTTDLHQIQVEAEPQQLVGQVDPGRVERILANLLSNAVKYTPEPGEILVRLRGVATIGGEMAELVVRDHGVGIPATDLPLIFVPFHRGANVRHQIAGTGLGLAGVHRTVEQHGGTIAVTSVEGEGTTFTIRLPLKASGDRELVEHAQTGS